MALIGKIREKSVLLVVIIGLALLAFIMGAYGKMGSGSGDTIGYGTVFGEKVDYKEYETMSAKFIEQDQNQFAQQQREYTQADQDASADKAWNYTTETIIFNKEYEALGVDVSEREFDAFLYGTDGFQVMQDLAQAFKDSATGMFNAKLLEKRINEMETSNDPTVQQQWKDSKKYYTDRRKQEKYFGLIGQGVYVTKLEAEDEYYAQKEIKSISYVVRRFTEIDDNNIKISDQTLKEYYENHKNDKKYENKNASREVRFFDVLINPSKTDSLKFNRTMLDLKREFASAKNDSLFIIQNSDVKFYSSSKFATAVPEGSPSSQRLQLTYPATMDTIFKTAGIGQLVGPYTSKQNVVVSKIIGFTPTRMKARHILLATNQSKDPKVISQKQKLADSLVKLINKDNFADFVSKYSDDKGSVSQGGLIDNFIEADMVPEFGAFCATKPVGSIGTIKTMYGIHIIEVLERDNTNYPLLASVQKTFAPSQETLDSKESEVYNLLYKLDAKLATKSTLSEKLSIFDTIAQKAGYMVRPITIMEESPKIYGFNTTFAEDKILKLAFSEESKVGDLTSAPIKDKNRYVIAIVSSIKEKGVPLFEDAQVAMKKDLIEEKKAARFTNQLLKDKSLNAMAKSSNTEVLKAEVTFANPQIAGSGFEPEIVGYLFSGIKKGRLSAPLKGKLGVYVLMVDKTTKAPATSNYKAERDQMQNAMKGSVQGQSLAALKKKAEVMDNRRFLKAGIRR